MGGLLSVDVEMEHDDMKKLLTTAAFLTLIATPAFAQTFDPDMGTGNIARPLVMNQGGGSAYAYAPGDYETRYSPARYGRGPNYYRGGPYYYRSGPHYYGGSGYYYRLYKHWTEF